MAITLYHNPRCSKSRQALALLEEHGAEVTVRRYLDEPLNEEELRDLMSRLDADGERLVRTQEAEWQEVDDTDLQDQEQVIAALLRFPKLLERPIADDGKRAVIGRPPEDVLALLHAHD
ncbi:arsenate reductase (glutaredoxin) [Halomonas sp. MCCC 1A17488]|uniref:Arsenate reductase n=1 Tax=Billgrantia sulfidoxydans TaxID=2733484 RepID=A0ABX7W3Y1_9GAMM|nr:MULTISPECIES: arsenate reductase (glutaredoxin) [Halomonas]MCE8015147.1 arsenate reductase (glutaredoxin) [Halomonas sp. MCCC 1A17488]MCG3238480.1 arsenate reductase (glutaredoxin) [Halomonas sp. MCCC 1A17488]QPP47779.1 arsenate reductase (glutaredoxin) [Halomonas sp. SS10-MC5]QTP55086.1 arsenate reductase (glutaredoxin) [Halomonas sulfidoxydans]